MSIASSGGAFAHRSVNPFSLSAPRVWGLVALGVAALALGGCGGGAGNVRDASASRVQYDSSGTFPVPDEIRPNVDFWRNVYGVWSRGQVVFHDDENMGVIYEVAQLPGAIHEGYTEQQKSFVKARTAMYREQLRDLETKVRTRAPLSPRDKELLAKIEKGAGAGGVYGAADRLRSQRGVRERFRKGVEISGRYDAEFREIMRRHGVPDDLAYLPHVESSFQTHARSSVGAAGVWQFMPTTGREFGMDVNHTIDERLDPIICADGAARYLAGAHRRLGSWPLAITSYNHGVGGMANAKSAYGNDIGKIVRNYDGRAFGFSSRNFYASFVAAREVAANAERYFPEGVRYEQPWNHDQLVLRSPMPAYHVAKHYGVSTGSLKSLNLHWRDPVHTGRAHLPSGTTVWLPAGSTRRVASHPPAYRAPVAEPSRETLVARNVAKSKPKTSAPSPKPTVVMAKNEPRKPAPKVAAKAKPAAKPAPRYHVVQPKETLYRVATMNGMSVSDLRKLNRMAPSDNNIKVGQKLKVGI